MHHPIGQTRNGRYVYVDLIHSLAATHLSQQPRLLDLVQEVLRDAAFHDEMISLEYNMGRSIGYDYVVITSDSDTVFYAQPLKDSVFTRYVKNGKPLATRHMALLLHRDSEGSYELDDTWIGRLSPPRIGSPGESTESLTYWASHAVVFDHQPIQTKSITRISPYTLA